MTHVISCLGMGKFARSLLTVLMLTLWVVSGPIGMAFDGCAMMGAMCEAPCGISSYITGRMMTNLSGLEPLAALATLSTTRPPLVSASPLTPPPKSALRSA
jgi:hypothetical protein